MEATQVISLKSSSVLGRLVRVLGFPVFALGVLVLRVAFVILEPLVYLVLYTLGWVLKEDRYWLFPQNGPPTSQCQTCGEKLPSTLKFWTNDHFQETGHNEFRVVRTASHLMLRETIYHVWDNYWGTAKPLRKPLVPRPIKTYKDGKL